MLIFDELTYIELKLSDILLVLLKLLLIDTDLGSRSVYCLSSRILRPVTSLPR